MATYQSIPSGYLNKGTHEEDRAEEFDAGVVRRMLETVIKLDKAIEAP